MTEIVISLNPEDFESIRRVMKEVMHEERAQQLAMEQLRGTYSVNRAKKILGIGSHETMNKLIRAGHLGTTPDGRRITGESLNKYLKNQ